MALNGYVISGDVYAWTAVFILPFNSALNPVLYTLTAIIGKQVHASYTFCFHRTLSKEDLPAQVSEFIGNTSPTLHILRYLWGVSHYALYSYIILAPWHLPPSQIPIYIWLK